MTGITRSTHSLSCNYSSSNINEIQDRAFFERITVKLNGSSTPDPLLGNQCRGSAAYRYTVTCFDDEHVILESASSSGPVLLVMSMCFIIALLVALYSLYSQKKKERRSATEALENAINEINIIKTNANKEKENYEKEIQRLQNVLLNQTEYITMI